ncbi:MAG TPA: PilN domain-containing protein [Terriglobia bacterium]|nr:PilN domain-containing protein [Terriglobia bacterium]
MGQFDLNLSTRPFKPYRAANFGLLVVLLALIAVSAGQLLSYQQYSSLADESRQAEQDVRMSNDELTAQVQQLNAKMASGNANAKLSEVELLNRLLVRKSFSWTAVFANLERVMSDDVRLVSLIPFVDEKGQIGLTMNIRGRTLSDATAFLRTLEDSDIFTDVSLSIQEKKDAAGEVQFTLTASYTPPEPKASITPPSNAQSKVVK